MDWVSLLKKNRKLEVLSFVLRDEFGQPMTLTGPHIKVEELVPLIPHNAYRKVKVGDKSYWCLLLRNTFARCRMGNKVKTKSLSFLLKI